MGWDMAGSYGVRNCRKRLVSLVLGFELQGFFCLIRCNCVEGRKFQGRGELAGKRAGREALEGRACFKESACLAFCASVGGREE